MKPHIQGTAFPVTEPPCWLPGAQPTWDEGGYGRSQPFETEPAVEVRSTHSQACWALSTSGVGNPPGSCGNAGAGAALQNSGSLSGRCSRIKFPRCSQGSDLKPGGPGPPVPDGATDRSPLAKSDDIGKKLIFLGSRNSRALKCRTQGKLCELPQSLSLQVWGRVGEGPWCWVSGAPGQTLKEETAGVGPLLLSCPLLLHRELGRAQARGRDCVIRFLPRFHRQKN